MAINKNVLAENQATVLAEDGNVMYATIQMRHGKESEMDKSKFVPAELGVATDTKKMVVAFAPNDTKEVAFKDDLKSWTGKTIVFEGDSITWNTTIGYPKYISDNIGCEVVNIAIPGVPVCPKDPESNNDFRIRNQNIPADVDAIIILGDTNSRKEATTEDIYTENIDKWAGRWNLKLKSLKRSFPTIPIFLVACFRQGGTDSVEVNSKYVSEAFRKFSERWGCIYIDLSTESSLNLLYSAPVWGLTPDDGVHPNHDAMPLFADVILNHIQKVKPYNFTGIDNIDILESEIDISVGDNHEISYNITGDMSIKWSSDNVNVATVIGGTIYSMSPGKAIITAETRSGKSASVTVNVT